MHKILIVEDSPTIRSMIISTLDPMGEFAFTEAESGFEALKVLPRDKFDLVVTDINMPDINGLELVSFIKKNDAYKNIPLIIVSTEGSDYDIKKGLDLGANAYIVKPFNPQELQSTVMKLLQVGG